MKGLLSKFEAFLPNFMLPINKGGVHVDLSDKVVLITGASGEIGLHIAKILQQENAKLVLVSRNIDKLQKLPVFKQFAGLMLKGDVTNQKQMNSVVATAVKKFGRIDCLINCAGIIQNKQFDQTQLVDFEQLINTNVKGVYLATQAVLPVMKKQKDGLIVNIGSKISHNTNVSKGLVLYATSKYALEGFSFALNKELKPYHIRVSCLMPGTVVTYFSKHSGDLLHPDQIGRLISVIIKFEEIDFEGLIIKSRRQDI